MIGPPGLPGPKGSPPTEPSVGGKKALFVLAHRPFCGPLPLFDWAPALDIVWLTGHLRGRCPFDIIRHTGLQSGDGSPSPCPLAPIEEEGGGGGGGGAPTPPPPPPPPPP